MYKLLYDTYGYAYAIEKDGEIILHLLAGAETTVANAESIVELLNKSNDF